jgi:hypothetical protein
MLQELGRSVLQHTEMKGGEADARGPGGVGGAGGGACWTRAPSTAWTVAVPIWTQPWSNSYARI